MSLMNCAFTVRWSDEKNKPHAKTYATESDAKRAKKWLLEHGVRSVDVAVKINNKPAGSLKDDNPSETDTEQKGILVGEVSSIISLTKQQVAVYKIAQKPTPQNKVLENVRLEVVEQEKGIYKATLIATDGYKLIRREVDAEPGAKACSMNIPQSVIVAAEKVMKNDLDRAYVHDGRIVVRTNPYGEMVPIDESFPIKAEIPFQEQTELRFPETRPFVEQKSSEAFPVKSVVVNPKLLIEALRQFKQSDGMMGGVTIHVGKYDEPILIKSSPDYAWDGNEIVAGVAPIKSDDT